MLVLHVNQSVSGNFFFANPVQNKIGRNATEAHRFWFIFDCEVKAKILA